MTEHTWDESDADAEYQADGEEEQLWDSSVESKGSSLLPRTLTLLPGR